MTLLWGHCIRCQSLLLRNLITGRMFVQAVITVYCIEKEKKSLQGTIEWQDLAARELHIIRCQSLTLLLLNSNSHQPLAHVPAFSRLTVLKNEYLWDDSFTGGSPWPIRLCISFRRC